MKHLATTLILAALLTAGPSIAEESEDRRMLFEDPERDGWQKPVQVIRLMSLEKGQKVAGIGEGAFPFMRRLSLKVKEPGVVYAVDDDPELLAYLESLENLSRYDNFVTVQGNAEDPRLPVGELDRVLIVNGWHAMENRKSYSRKLSAALKSTGRLVIIDWHPEQLSQGPPAEDRLDRGEVVAELEKEGWKLVTESVILPYQYYLSFMPPR
jgi:predicted methyltransferase